MEIIIQSIASPLEECILVGFWAPSSAGGHSYMTCASRKHQRPEQGVYKKVDFPFDMEGALEGRSMPEKSAGLEGLVMHAGRVMKYVRHFLAHGLPSWASTL